MLRSEATTRDGACPSRGRPGLSLGANTHELIHTLPHPRYDREAAPRRRTRSRLRGKRRGASPRRAGCPPRSRAGVRRAASTASERRASRRVVDIRPRRSSPTVRREYHRVSPSSSPRIPPGATRGRGEEFTLSATEPTSQSGGCVHRGFRPTTRRCRRRPR